ncbi:hypothetical protein MOUN0_O09054 [Monosporozyma unispora]|nr:hypothetical protein C6P44_003505 [Kazachstania unispora]
MRRFLTTYRPLLVKRYNLPPRPKFTKELEAEVEESFLHGGRGPGGQKINKCNSKVQLKHIPTGTVVSCQETRSRSQNRIIAREKLALELEKQRHGGELTPREDAIKRLALQNKRAKDKKSQTKHSQHKLLNEAKKKEQELEDEMILQTILQDSDASEN